MSNSSFKSDEEGGLKGSVQAQEIPVLLENDGVQNILEIRFPPDVFKRPMFAAFLVGVTAFACPGMFSALNGLGAGGTAEPTISNISNAVTFGTIAVGGFLTGTITNQIGVKQSLLIGAGFYSPYAAALYISTRGNSNYKWFMPVSGFILGVSAAFLWIASSGILLGYPTVKDKGKAIVTGGTLLALTFVMLIGIPAALLLLTPRQINRGDGSKVDVFKQPSIWHEFALLKQIILRKDVVLLIPLFIYNQWYLSYQWNFNYTYFSLRGRALNSFLFYLFGTIGAWISGLFLDLQRVRTITRARSGFTVFSIIAGASWILGLVVESQWKNNTLCTIGVMGDLV
ncbi:hypothetical protein LJB42_002438 [Komagataella kurtzmanii]|nr:hypothetical protein LJB42_002438 [Komagataella kurtzmanii]